jgi:hypothetical protein
MKEKVTREHVLEGQQKSYHSRTDIEETADSAHRERGRGRGRERKTRF